MWDGWGQLIHKSKHHAKGAVSKCSDNGRAMLVLVSTGGEIECADEKCLENLQRKTSGGIPAYTGKIIGHETREAATASNALLHTAERL